LATRGSAMLSSPVKKEVGNPPLRNGRGRIFHA
jgi:hypothetical protein